MAQRTTLTEAQIALLRWVSEGCPAGVYEGVHHRISAAALARRDLISGATTTYSTARVGDLGWAEAPGIAEVSTVTDPDGVATITKTDRSGDVVVEQTGDPAVPGSLATTTHAYGALGRLGTSVGPDGVQTSYHYDIEGRTTGVATGPDPDDPDHTVTTTYDAWGNVETTTTPAGLDPDDDPVSSTTKYVTDEAGRTVAQIDGYGGVTADQFMTGFQYDGAGRLWRTIEHLDGDLDPAGRHVISDDDRVTETRYTLAGRTGQQVEPPPDATSLDWDLPDSAKAVTAYTYDDAGRQTAVVGPDGLQTETNLDLAGRTESTTSPGGVNTSFTYDAAGQATSTIGPSGLPRDPVTGWVWGQAA